MAVIRPNGTVGKLRNLVKYIMYTEVFVCILNMCIFDILSGFTHSISVWIDYLAYAQMSQM